MKKKLLLRVLGMALKALSPLMRRSLENQVNKLYETAKSTAEEHDDLMVEALAELLDIDLD